LYEADLTEWRTTVVGSNSANGRTKIQKWYPLTLIAPTVGVTLMCQQNNRKSWNRRVKYANNSTI